MLPVSTAPYRTRLRWSVIKSSASKSYPSSPSHPDLPITVDTVTVSSEGDDSQLFTLKVGNFRCRTSGILSNFGSLFGFIWENPPHS